jgi:hypothetical protein
LLSIFAIAAGVLAGLLRQLMDTGLHAQMKSWRRPSPEG